MGLRISPERIQNEVVEIAGPPVHHQGMQFFEESRWHLGAEGDGRGFVIDGHRTILRNLRLGHEAEPPPARRAGIARRKIQTFTRFGDRPGSVAQN
jgi:hypothetical protein